MSKFNPKSPVIVVSVELENKGVKVYSKLVLDTGATYTMVSWGIAEYLGFKFRDKLKTVPLNTASGEIRAPLMKMQEVSTLGMTAKNVEVIIHNLPASARVDGLLGLSFLRNFNLKIDFKNGFLELN